MDSGPTGRPDELALVDGTVLTQDDDRPEAEAVGVVGNRIAAVGATDEVLDSVVDPEVVDLDGRVLLPGFIDAHQHPLGFGLGRAGIWIDCAGVESVEELVAMAEERAESTPDGEWVFGRGWPMARLDRLPTREDFAGRVESNPVWLNDLSGHLWVLNDVAVDRIGLEEVAEPPERGRIDRDTDGTPTGVLRDCTPFEFAEMDAPVDDGEIREALRATMRTVTAFGITTIGQIGIRIPPGTYGTERVRPWLELERAGELDVRVRLMLEPYEHIHAAGESTYLDELADLGFQTGFGSDRVRLGPLKIIADGWQDAWSGYMQEPYAGAQDGERGYLKRADPEDYRRMVRAATEAGLQVAIHADGDASAEVILDAFESVAEAYPERFAELRHRFEHARVLTDEQVERIADLGIDVCAAPVAYSREPWYLDMLRENLGPEREHELLRHRSLHERGVVVSGGSDLHPGVDEWMSPLSSIEALVARGPADERFTVEEALRIYTINGAHSYREEDRLGSVTPGKLADLVVLDGDPRSVPPDAIGDIGVETTVVGGEVVHDDGAGDGR